MKRAWSVLLLLALAVPAVPQTDWIRTGTGLGVERLRMAVADFKISPADPQSAQLVDVFNSTLWNDLDQAGLFDMVSKSFYPLQQPSQPGEVVLDGWRNPPPQARMLAFGNLAASAGQLTMQGWLYDVANQQSPQVLGKQFTDAATAEGARTLAHKFANEIIYQLGGAIQSVTQTKIVFISGRSGHKEVWEMDYDGNGQHAVTHLGSITLSPRISPDGSRLAFTSFARSGSELMMYSLDLGRLVAFPRYRGTSASPAWAPDGSRLAFSSSMSGDPELYLVGNDGTGLKRLTHSQGPDVSPCFNPKTGAQIAFVSGRTGLPQIYTMDADGSNVQRLTDGGYAVSPSWSPNGQFLVFAWNRKYGPGAPGNQDIYLMDLASKRWVQLTHDAGTNDYPSWAPDGRHIVFQSNRSGSPQIWTMLADGTHQTPLTRDGSNTMPNWSWK